MRADPATLFRYAGLAACVIVSASNLAEVVAAGPEGLMLKNNLANPAAATVAFRLIIVFLTAMGLAFAGLFWLMTSPLQERWSTRTCVILLLVHCAIAVQIPQESLIIVAGEAGFILRARAGFLWIASQSLLEAALVWGALVAGDCVPIEGIPHVPKTAACVLTGVVSLAWTWFAYFAGFLASTERRERRALARALVELRATQNLLADSSRMAERLRIARELHDAFGSHLTGLSLHLQLASRLPASEAAAPVQKAHMIARLMLNDVRDALTDLRREKSLDLPKALRELTSGIPSPLVRLEIPGDFECGDVTQAHVLFRCVQEIVTNAIRHSGARNLSIELARTAEGVALSAKDDGRGAPSLSAGNGLRGMRERVEEIGGQLRIETHPGFEVRVWLPAGGGSA